MTCYWDFLKNRYPSLRCFEVHVPYVKNGESLVLLSEVISKK